MAWWAFIGLGQTFLCSLNSALIFLHLFCYHRSKCPCCNKKVTADKLYPDWAFDNLISMVSAEKNKAEDNYFVNLIQKAGTW